MAKRSAFWFARTSSAAMGLLVVIAGCPGSLASPERFFVEAGLEVGPIQPRTDAASDPEDATIDAEGCPPDVVTDLFKPRCATAPCHSSIAQLEGLDLETPDVGQRLLGRPSSTNPGLRIIDVGAPEESLLYLKVGPTPPIGNRMPIGAAPLSETEQACVLAWIKAVVATAPPQDAAIDAPAD